MLKKMCSDVNIHGNFTNHNLRATSATLLFNAGVPESIIQKRTGHKSLDALRTYERVTPAQEQAVSQILSNPTTSFNINKEPQDSTDDYPISGEDMFFMNSIPDYALQD